MEENNYVGKDLIKVLILTLVFCGGLITLKIIDNRSSFINNWAEKITSVVIK